MHLILPAERARHHHRRHMDSRPQRTRLQNTAVAVSFMAVIQATPLHTHPAVIGASHMHILWCLLLAILHHAEKRVPHGD